MGYARQSRPVNVATKLVTLLLVSWQLGCAHGGVDLSDLLDEVRTLNLAEIDMIGCDCEQDVGAVQHRKCLDEGDEQICQSMLMTLDSLQTHAIVTNAMRAKPKPWWRRIF